MGKIAQLAGYGSVRERNDAIVQMRVEDRMTFESIAVKVNLTRQRVKQICGGNNIVNAVNRKSIRTYTKWGTICPACRKDKRKGRLLCNECKEKHQPRRD